MEFPPKHGAAGTYESASSPNLITNITFQAFRFSCLKIFFYSCLEEHAEVVLGLRLSFNKLSFWSILFTVNASILIMFIKSAVNNMPDER